MTDSSPKYKLRSKSKAKDTITLGSRVPRNPSSTITLSGSEFRPVPSRNMSTRRGWSSLRRHAHRPEDAESLNHPDDEVSDDDDENNLRKTSTPKQAVRGSTSTSSSSTADADCGTQDAKGKEADADEGTPRVRVIRALGLTRGKWGGQTDSPKQSSRQCRYYCTVTVKSSTDSWERSSKKNSCTHRTTLEGRLLQFEGARTEEVEWNQTVDLPTDNQDIVIEFRVHARRKYLPDRLVARTEFNARGALQSKHPYHTLVLEKGEGEARSLLQIAIETPQQAQNDSADELPKTTWPWLCTASDAVRLLANGHVGENERSYLGMLPPELVEKLCEVVDCTMGYDPFRDGPPRERQLLSETMRMRSSSVTNWNRWKPMRVRSVPSYAHTRRSMVPPGFTPTEQANNNNNSHSTSIKAIPRTNSPTASGAPISPALFLSSSVSTRQTTASYRYKSLTFWHPHELEDPIIVRGNRKKGYLTARVVEAGNEHTLTDRHTICYLQSSRSDQTFMIREFKDTDHKAFVWSEETLAQYVSTVLKRPQTVAVLEHVRRAHVCGVPAFGCTFAVSVPARTLHALHKKGLKDYEIITVWFAIFDRSCFQIQYGTCAHSGQQPSLAAALTYHRKAEESTFGWMMKTLGWQQEVQMPRTLAKSTAAAPNTATAEVPAQPENTTTTTPSSY